METFDPSLSFPFSYLFPGSTTLVASYPLHSSSSSSSGPWMDSRIWSRLPLKLLDRIIAFLPPPSFLRARSVCKRWYSLLFSPVFLQLYLTVSPNRPCFLFFKHKPPNSFIYRHNATPDNSKLCAAAPEGYLFDPTDSSWYHINFSNVIPHGFYPAASSGGLICWVSDEAGPKSLILCNPLVGSLTPLPPTTRPRLFPSVGLSVTPSSIDVAIAGDDLISPYAVKNLTNESFHIDGSGFFSLWGTSCTLPRLCCLESGRMVCVEGKFYCMNYSPYSVLAYNVGGNSWYKIQAPMRRFLRSPSLVESRGRLLLVAAVEKSKLNVPKSLRVWGLQGDNNWVEMERMPQQLYLQFDEVEAGKGFECMGNGEYVMIVIRGGTSLMLDMGRKRWEWVTPCPYIDHAQDELHGFAYNPRLATPVTAILDHLNALHFQSFST